MPTPRQVELAAQAFALLADPTRLLLVWELRRGERTVNDLASAVGRTPATVSQHLAKLRLAGAVLSHRDGSFVRYRLADSHLGEVVEDGLYHADHLDQGLPDHPPVRRHPD